MSLKLVKLISGEEVIGDDVTTDLNAGTVALQNCVAIVLNPTKDGITYGFMPWGSLTKDDKVIGLDKIIYTATPNDELKNGYNSMFGGIVTPGKQLIT